MNSCLKLFVFLARALFEYQSSIAKLLQRHPTRGGFTHTNCMHERVRACVCVCKCLCVRACVRTCVRAEVRARRCTNGMRSYYTDSYSSSTECTYRSCVMEDLLRASGGTAGEALGLGAGAQKEAISRWIVAARGRYCASCKLNEQIQSNKRFCFVNLYVCECVCTCMYVTILCFL